MKKYGYMIIFILILCAAALSKGRDGSGEGRLRVSFLGVGQGDATLIETPSGKSMLIDGGPSNEVVGLIGEARPFWDRSIDIAVLTHPQNDHVTGLVPVFEMYDVKRAIITEINYNLDAYAALLRSIERKRIPVTVAKAGDTIDFRDGVVASILSPMAIFAGKSPGDTNETSVVLRLDYNKTSYLFTGDADFKIESELLQTRVQLATDVLKVGHHGSKNSSGEEFLKAIMPKIAVIEVGAGNAYGHPAPDALARLSVVGARVFRTDRDGTVVLETDGTTVFRAIPAACPLFCSEKKEILLTE